MQLIPEHPWFAEANSQRLTSLAFILIAAIATIDSVIVVSIGLGFLYLIPLSIASAFLSRWQILILATICTAFCEAFSDLPAGVERIPRVAFVFMTYTLISLLVREMVVFRRAASRRLRELEHEVAIRHAAQEHLEILLNSSPAGIVTVSPEGKIEVCNLAAHQIFRVAPGGLTSLPISSFLPLFDQVDGVKARNAMEWRGRRANGEAFLARIWSSVIPGGAGATAAIIVDASEDVDDGGTEEP